MQRIPVVPGDGENVCDVPAPGVEAAAESAQSTVTDMIRCYRSLTHTCPRKGFFTTASPFPCLPWRCSSWARGGRRKLVKSSSWCSSLTPKELGETRTDSVRTRRVRSMFMLFSCSRQWLPRDKLLPMGTDDTVDKLRLMEGKKPSIRKSVHTAYDRAMVHLNHIRGNVNFSPSNFI